MKKNVYGACGILCNDLCVCMYILYTSYERVYIWKEGGRKSEYGELVGILVKYIIYIRREE